MGAARHLLEVLATRESQDSSDAEETAEDGAQASADAPTTEQRPSDDGDPAECCVCLDKAKTHALLPCGHLCACMDCSAFLAARNSACPVCRCPIERAVQIFV